VGAAAVGGSEEPSLGAAFVSTVKQWGPILQDEKLRCVMALHSAYWVATSGSTMTLLPLMLVSDGHFNLGVGEAGMVFAYMAAVNVVRQGNTTSRGSGGSQVFFFFFFFFF
jgi:hypothetical protein